MTTNLLTIICKGYYLPVILGLLLWGCVIPMPIELDETEANFAPSFDPLWVSPTPAMIIEYDPIVTDGQAIEFDIGPIGDPNKSDTLFWRVFLNYQGRFYNAIYRSNQGGGLSISKQGDNGLIVNVYKSYSGGFIAPLQMELIASILENSTS